MDVYVVDGSMEPDEAVERAERAWRVPRRLATPLVRTLSVDSFAGEA